MLAKKITYGWLIATGVQWKGLRGAGGRQMCPTASQLGCHGTEDSGHTRLGVSFPWAWTILCFFGFGFGLLVGFGSFWFRGLNKQLLLNLQSIFQMRPYTPRTPIGKTSCSSLPNQAVRARRWWRPVWSCRASYWESHWCVALRKQREVIGWGWGGYGCFGCYGQVVFRYFFRVGVWCFCGVTGVVFWQLFLDVVLVVCFLLGEGLVVTVGFVCWIFKGKKGCFYWWGCFLLWGNQD